VHLAILRALSSLVRGMRDNLRAWVIARRLKTQMLSDVLNQLENVHTELNSLQKTLTKYSKEVDELRADSRRVAELRILVENQLISEK